MNLFFKILSACTFVMSAYLFWQHTHIKELIIQALKDDSETVSEVAIEGFEKIRKRSMDEMKENQKKKLAEKNETILSSECPFLGNPDGPIKILEFLDFRCGHCRAVSSQLNEFLKENKDVRVNLHFLPILGDESATISIYALLAKKHGKFDAFYKKMMECVFPDEMAAASILESLHIKIKSEAVKNEIKELHKQIIEDTTLAQELDVAATPSFIVGDEIITGAQIDELQKAVEKLRKSH